MQISFTGGFLANGGILQISRLKVNLKRDLYCCFVSPVLNTGFFLQKSLPDLRRKRLRAMFNEEKKRKGQKMSYQEAKGQ